MVAKKSKTKSKPAEEDVFDERFIAAVNRPQFQKHKQEKTKVVLDERFASVLTDERFSLQTKDKYGRKKKGKKKKSTAESELSEFYTVEKPEEEHDGDDKEEERPEKSDATSDDNDDDNKVEQEDEEEDEEEDQDPASRIAYLTALSRGELDVSESSSDDDSSESSEDDSDSDVDSLYGKAGVLDPSNKEEDEVSITSVPSPFMAVMNMDWSQVRAVDLFAILSSFTPHGSIRKVQIFPSDFGMERMEKEKHYGPTGLWKRQKSKKGDDDDGSAGSEEVEEESDAGEPETDDDEVDIPKIKFEMEDEEMQSGFNSEKLRAYEASKLKYYFAVVEFSSPEHADVAYKEIDGMELEHSSATIDMRSIDPEQLDGVVVDRPLRDEALSIPSNYTAPDFVINALQQTNVECTWDKGDTDRERKLTQYSSKEGWQDLDNGEDLRAYLASDQSSDEESNDESDAEGKGSKMRALLGLDSGDEAAAANGSQDENDSDEEDEDGFGNTEEGAMEVSFIPGKSSLEDKIRNKLQGKDKSEELTPWEKYQEKRKQKRRERRQASRGKKKGEDTEQPAIESDERPEMGDDDFFMDEELEAQKKEKKQMQKKQKKKSRKDANDDHPTGGAPSTKEELALLVAGEEGDEDERDYDMRGLVRVDKLKGKKLKGARKRKQDKLAANVSGTGFKINTTDNRFAAVLQGADDRFGIDRTDPNYKDTEAMREILVEQSKHRKARKRQKKGPVAPNVSAEKSTATTGGAAALSSLVMSLKTKVSKRS